MPADPTSNGNPLKSADPIVPFDEPLPSAADIEKGALALDVQFNRINYTVNKDTDEEKLILDDISCTLGAGSLVALMGPSGAGKTTFLNILLQNAAHHQEGTVLVNGHEITHGFAKMCNYVPQDDVMHTAFSPRETLYYLAKLRMAGASKEERRAKVETVIKQLGLTDCADTAVGNADKRGLSGGQRKRLSVAMELLDDPKVLVLDEPTSGLDSKAAEDLVYLLHKLASGEADGCERLIVCTIHQPSWSILEVFDRMLLLAKGKKVYDGAVSKLPDYFADQETPVPKNTNPSDHAMRVIQGDGEDNRWAALWLKQAVEQQPLEPSAAVPWTDAHYAVTQWEQFKILVSRNSLDYFKDQEQFTQQICSKIFMGLLLGMCWLNTSRPTQSGENGAKIFTVTGVLFMVVNNVLMDDLMMTCMGFPSAKAILRREYKNGVYGMLPWFSAFWMTRFLSGFVIQLFMLMPVYFLVGLRIDEDSQYIFTAFGCLIVCSITGNTLGLTIGALSDSVEGAMGWIMPTLMPMMLFSDYLIPFSEIPFLFQWIYWISPFQYAFNILRINQFKDLHFSDGGCGDGLHIAGSTDTPLYCNGNEYLHSLELDVEPQWFMQRAFMFLSLLAVGTFIMAFHVLKYKTSTKTG